MSDSAYVVVPAESANPNQILGRVSFFNEDGTPWAPEGGGDAPSSIAWDDVTGKPTTFTPAAHTHSIADIEGLQEALDGKADAG